MLNLMAQLQKPLPVLTPQTANDFNQYVNSLPTTVDTTDRTCLPVIVIDDDFISMFNRWLRFTYLIAITNRDDLEVQSYSTANVAYRRFIYPEFTPDNFSSFIHTILNELIQYGSMLVQTSYSPLVSDLANVKTRKLHLMHNEGFIAEGKSTKLRALKNALTAASEKWQADVRCLMENDVLFRRNIVFNIKNKKAANFDKYFEPLYDEWSKTGTAKSLLDYLEYPVINDVITFLWYSNIMANLNQFFIESTQENMIVMLDRGAWATSVFHDMLNPSTWIPINVLIRLSIRYIPGLHYVEESHFYMSITPELTWERIQAAPHGFRDYEKRFYKDQTLLTSIYDEFHKRLMHKFD